MIARCRKQKLAGDADGFCVRIHRVLLSRFSEPRGGQYCSFVVELELVDVRIDEVTKQPFLELKASDGTNRVLPIAVGLPEGAAVKYGLEQRTTPRPMTHDLLGHIIEACGATLDQVVITDFHDQIYFAELHLSIGTERKTVSCRPSDAIALAVRVGASIFVNDEVLSRQGITPPAETPSEGGEELVDEFRKFIDDINPEDFR
jgi:uncharacterized protein